MSVCIHDGVEVGESRTGRLVHLGDLPKGVDSEHEVYPVTAGEYAAGIELRFSLKGAAEDMLLHHATLHPQEGCQWAEALLRALKSA